MLAVSGLKTVHNFRNPISSPCARHQHARGHRGGFLFGPGCDLVFGTGIVGKQVLSRARKTALNMHTGSPRITEGAIAISGLSTTGTSHARSNRSRMCEGN